MRTFRQRPTVVGRTEQGETVYEVRSVRLLLPRGSPHFRRLVHCAKCGSEVAGSPVLTLDDLERQPNAVFCGNCVRAAPTVLEAAPAPAPWGNVTQENGSRVAAVEARLAEVTRRLESSPDVDPEVAALAAAVAEAQGQLRKIAGGDAGPGIAAMIEAHRRELGTALAEGQRELRAEISALEQQVRDQAAAVKPLADRQQALEGKLSETFAEARAEMRAVVAKMDEVRSADWQAELRADLSALAQQTRDEADTISGLIAAQRGDLEQALADVVQRTLAAVATPLQALTDRQQALEEKLSENLAAARAEVLTLLAERAEAASVDDLRAAIESRLSEVQAGTARVLEAERQPMADGLDRLRADVAALAHAVERARAQGAQDVLDAVSDPLRDLTRARQDTERRLEELTSSAEVAASRLHALEQRALTALAPLMPEASGPRRPPGELLESLERQLREAEERLAQR